jgi:predicted Zn-dependent peptidase
MEVMMNPNESEIASAKIMLETLEPANVNPAAPAILSVILNEGSKTKNYDSFYEGVHKAGMNLKFDAGFKAVSANVESMSGDLGYALDLIKEVFNEPRMNALSFNYAKGLVKETILNTENSASDKALKALFPNMPEFATKEELLKAVDNITLAEVQGLFDYIKKYSKARAVFTAPFEKNPQIENTVLSKLSTGLNTFRPFEVEHFNSYVPISENVTLTKAEPRNQADIVRSYKFKTNYNPKDHVVFAVLNTILGEGPYSRLFNDLREKQKLAYAVDSNLDFIGNTGIMTLGIKTTTDNPSEGVVQYDNVEKSLAGFDEHVKKITTEKVTKEEINAAKLRLKTKILNSIETSNSKTNILLDSKDTIFGVNATNETLKLLDEITEEDILNSAKYIFDSNSITSILASQNTLDNINLPKIKMIPLSPHISVAA